MCTGFVAAKVQEAVAVADNALPDVLVQRLDLRNVLHDDTHADFP